MRLKRWFLGLSLFLGATLPGTADTKNGVQPLQGRWSTVLVFVNGEGVPADQVKSGELVVENDQYRAKLGGNTSTAAIKVDSSKAPKQIDFTYTSGEQKGKTVKGIYKVDDDVLTICRGLTDAEARPTEFAAPVDSGLLLVTWKRSKAAAAEKAKAIVDELKRFQATWRFVAVEVDGETMPERVFQKDTLILKGNTFASFVAGKLVHGIIKVDPTAKPKTIDIIFTEGPGKGHTQKGIYELQGDIQKICIALPDKPRPTEFATKIDSGHVLEILKRETR